MKTWGCDVMRLGAAEVCPAPPPPGSLRLSRWDVARGPCRPSGWLLAACPVRADAGSWLGILRTHSVHTGFPLYQVSTGTPGTPEVPVHQQEGAPGQGLEHPVAFGVRSSEGAPGRGPGPVPSSRLASRFQEQLLWARCCWGQLGAGRPHWPATLCCLRRVKRGLTGLGAGRGGGGMCGGGEGQLGAHLGCSSGGQS